MQVRLLIEEYLSYPTITNYLMKDVDMVPAPAFTICSQPSVKTSFKLDPDTDFMEFEEFSRTAVLLFDVVLHIPFSSLKFTNSSSVNGETIFLLPKDKGHWNERTLFAENKKKTHYFKCYTLFSNKYVETQPNGCLGGTFVFDFKDLGGITEPKREKFALRVSRPEKLVIFNNTITSLFIRPEVIQKLSRKDAPCSQLEDYSYTRCMENCFWERFQSRPGLPCIISSLLTQEVNLTVPKCQDRKSEKEMVGELLSAIPTEMPTLADNCNCPRRCNMTEYHISGDPTSACSQEVQSFRGAGRAILFFTFPSKLVPHFLEKEKVTLPDLLSNIGGIVGVCLGISLITIFDIVEQVRLMLEEYQSFPTNTLYKIDDVEAVSAPAFTVCPKPSVKSSLANRKDLGFNASQNASVSLGEIVWFDNLRLQRPQNKSSANGETIIQISDGSGHWTQRTFYGKGLFGPNLQYFKCFTLFLTKYILTGPGKCAGQSFMFMFTPIKDAPDPQFEVFIHDQREKYTFLDIFRPEKVVLLNNAIANIFIRPEMIQKQSKKENPCSVDEGYSYYRVPHFLEKEKTSLLDLLANIAGIVGICLGVSLISIYDVIAQISSLIHEKLLRKSNKVIQESNP
ncbi:unnamed protein product [Darwinula stevensoni]|uniref:Uncharacterized protein n=1 Tax=Darwinula stevensoni TaxID=69355 RepID=A0A7R8XBS9_9CRUS|nr:unnamed protein product [Darwinula stevensoni]CAG0885161.1 unnamed protein product [Darwinula stevensoni]